jgi:hypothetical protein
MTMHAKLSKTGEIKLPEAIVEQLQGENFEVEIREGKLILSPIVRQHHFGPAWRNLTPAERVADFNNWMKRIEDDPTREPTNISDEDLRRENMYEDRL